MDGQREEDRFRGYYCKACYPAMMVVVIVCNILLYFLYI